MESTVLDWTRGTDGIAYQRCQSCSAVQYFHRDFCARCGKQSLIGEQSSGTGILYALTTVHRAPSEALRAFTPYCIGLIDMTEGFRVMAHVAAGVKLGDPVSAQFADFGDQRVPIFHAL